MNIVASNYMLKYFKNIDLFKVDLGFNIKGPVRDLRGKGDQYGIKIKDEFIKKYSSLNNKYIHKYGDIGKLKFYQDNSLSMNEFHVYHNDNIYEIVANNGDLSKSSKTYLTEILKMIENPEAEIQDKNSQNHKKNITYTNMSETESNKIKDYNPNVEYEKKLYIQEILNRRKLLDKI